MDTVKVWDCETKAKRVTRPTVRVPPRGLKRRMVAYHEAGHFVANVDSGSVPGIVSIRRGRGYAGICACDVNDRSFDAIAVVDFAGHAAAKRLAPAFCAYSRAIAGDDEEHARWVLTGHPVGTIEACRSRAAEVVRRRWGAVESLGAALLREGTILGEVADLIVAVSEGRATAEDLERCRAIVEAIFPPL